jgi:hypothetical protein
LQHKDESMAGESDLLGMGGDEQSPAAPAAGRKKGLGVLEQSLTSNSKLVFPSGDDAFASPGKDSHNNINSNSNINNYNNRRGRPNRVQSASQLEMSLGEHPDENSFGHGFDVDVDELAKVNERRLARLQVSEQPATVCVQSCATGSG